MKNLVLLLVALGLLAGGVCLGVSWHAHRPWTAWEDFRSGFVQADGRVVDHTAAARSTSEGQAYGLFFALVANDEDAFARILDWAQNNLAGGDLNRNLPAWLWGEDPEAGWGIRDPNAASDADLWIAYALLEAARLWGRPAYEALGRQVLWNVRTREVAAAGELGPILLPAPDGFRHGELGWRLNPSYLPEFQLRYFQVVDPSGPWSAVHRTADQMMPKVVINGVAPDWFEFDPRLGVQPDAKTGGIASYDAIRTYLWAGMTPDSKWLPLLAPFVGVIKKRGLPPERVDPQTRAIDGGSPLGFSAAVLPFLDAMNEDSLLEKQIKRLAESRINGALGDPAHYYDQVLALFGEGWLSGRYRFDRDGRMTPRWRRTCCDAFSS